jgi:hypothetical protein
VEAVVAVASRTVDPFSNSSNQTDQVSNLEETQMFSTMTQLTIDHRYSLQPRSST